ncbi:MAG: 4Fe-4S dicluster domain-containing protein [Acidimicrobiia bacterium]|nr:4Fe-4S dicluster domain-containing protein [Acidimicrobiia bacterium]
MAHDIPPLTPLPLGVLLDRIAYEWDTRKRIFDLPIARIYNVSDGPDLSMSFLGRPCATPIGPAAGPHSQLAENIVLSWLGGSRLIELKTVQILDELEIARPCIDMETIGYNIEWSQELKIPQSLEEYVKAWMIIEILTGWDELKPYIGDDPGPVVFDMSVGYDLAGISTPEVGAFIDGLIDASGAIERLRADIPDRFAAWRDHDFESRISDTVTLSTFHGCPPDEIESITKHLMTHHEVDVIVKLNPTLLGFDNVKSLVTEELGYDEIRLRKSDFDADLQFERGLELIHELLRFGRERDRRFGIKLSNTLVVENHRDFMPEETMYMSGAPLHVVTMTLLRRLHDALPGLLAVDGQDAPIQVSWSAGITRENFAASAGLGLAPMTVCSDLLKPGGYGRLKPMLKALTGAMEEAGCDSLAAWVAYANSEGSSVGSYVAALHDPATNEAYTREGTSKLPRQVDHDLEMWGCVACNFCVTVCPNDAFFRLPTPEDMDLDGRQQYFVIRELCNDCGNCMVFCPERGDPAVIKPRLFTSPDRFAMETEQQAYLIAARPDGKYMVLPNELGAGEDGATLAAILNADEGFPIPLEDLSTA